MKKYLSLMLSLLLIVSVMVGMIACADTPDTPDTPDGPGTTDPGETPPASTDERIPTDYLPSEQYGEDGAPATYHILQWSVSDSKPGSGWVPWEEGHVDEMDGDILGEAVFARNSAVEERYNVEITAEYAPHDGALFELMESNHKSGDDLYQLMTTRSVRLSDYLLNGQLLDMNDYTEYLHFDEPWWVPDSVTSYTLGEHLYAASSELLLRDKGATAALFFNRSLAKDIGKDTAFFEMVRAGDWTFYEMISACETVAHDNDGTTMMDSIQDIWGMSVSVDTTYYLYAATGNKFAVVNEEGLLEAAFGDDGDTVLLLEEIFETILFAEDWCFNGIHNESMNPEYVSLFLEGTSLFEDEMIKQISLSLNTMQEAYGILPLPKYDESQENYASLVWEHHDSVLGIPAAVKDPEFCAVILEALSWESYYTVSPDFYEGILLTRGARDEDSKAMLQLVLDTRVYDPGMFYGEKSGLHGGEGILLKPMNTWSADIASIWATFGDAFKEELGSINKIIQNIED